MENRDRSSVSRRQVLKAGLGLWITQETAETYFSPSEQNGGWRIGDPRPLGVDVDQLTGAINYHDSGGFTKSYGGALVIVYKGHVIVKAMSRERKAARSRGRDERATPWHRRSSPSVARRWESFSRSTRTESISTPIWSANLATTRSFPRFGTSPSPTSARNLGRKGWTLRDCARVSTRRTARGSCIGTSSPPTPC